MSPCRRFGLALRGHRTHLHDRSRQTDARSLAQRDSLLQLRGAFQLHDWQMLTAGRVADRKIQSNTASASNAGARCSARGAAGPVSSRLEPRCEASGCETLVDLVRCSTIECFAWPVAVVPTDEQRQLPSKAFALVGDQEPSRALTLDGPDHRRRRPHRRLLTKCEREVSQTR